MKNILLFLFSIVLFLYTTPAAHAGFITKKNIAPAYTTQSASAELNTISSTKPATTSISEAAQLLHAPVDRWAARGWIGTLSVIFGALGFIAPLFGFVAVILGFIGMNGKRSRHTGVAIAGFVLGLAVVLLVVFGGFTGWGIS